MIINIPKQESVSLGMIGTPASCVTPELDLVLEGILTIKTRVATRLKTTETMEINTSRPWDISLCNDKEFLRTCWQLMECSEIALNEEPNVTQTTEGRVCPRGV